MLFCFHIVKIIKISKIFNLQFSLLQNDVREVFKIRNHINKKLKNIKKKDFAVIKNKLISIQITEKKYACQ